MQGRCCHRRWGVICWNQIVWPKPPIFGMPCEQWYHPQLAVLFKGLCYPVEKGMSQGFWAQLNMTCFSLEKTWSDVFFEYIFPDSTKTVPFLSHHSLCLISHSNISPSRFLNSPNVKMSQATALELAETAERPVLCKCTYHWGECNRDIVCLCIFYKLQ